MTTRKNVSHTEAPWIAVHQPSREEEIATVTWVGDWCVGVQTPGYPGGNYCDTAFADAGDDARLIAAAPDLLAAARLAVCMLTTGDEWSAVYAALDAAIEKALGGVKYEPKGNYHER